MLARFARMRASAFERPFVLAQLARFGRLLPSTRASAFDLAFVITLFVVGAIFHWNFQYWAAGLIGGESYGDAHFWWDGAVRVSDAMAAEHPGKGYRPGYFVITGLSLPALGTDPVVFHKFLLLNFLAVSAFLYFALRQPFGRLAASAAIGLLVVNPYTAEWVATTTTDGLGLTLHLASLACLLIAVQRNLNLAWLCGFGLFFAAGNLTRPLLMPFIGVVVLVLLLAPPVNWRGRLRAAAVTVVAFAMPTLGWMAVQAAWVGEWSVSTNDASALYAASTPQYQVWMPAIYDEMNAKAVRRYKVANPTPAQLNAEFKRQARKNYYAHREWHLKRAVPHVWTVASFAPTKQITPHGTVVFQCAILSGLAVALAGLLLSRGFVQRAVLLATLAGVIWLSPHAVPFFTLAGCVLSLLRRPGRMADLGLFLLACYWLVGVLAMFLTGGTWIAQGSTHLTGLGVRVGSQFFFAGDLLACTFLIRIAQLNLPANTEATTLVARIRDRVGRALSVRLEPASLVAALLAALLIGDGVVFAIGLGSIARRAVVRKTTKPTSFPDAAPVVEFYKQKTTPDRRELAHVDQVAQLRPLLAPTGPQRREGPDVLVTGTTGSSVWEMTGQQRSQTYFHAQQHTAPSHLTSGCLPVELPVVAHLRDWGRRQGAFILRGSVDRPPTTNLPYYLQAASVRGFVPLKKVGTGYDLDGAVWFPLTRYASQLDAAGDLSCGTGTLTWANDSGPVPFQRRLRLVGKDGGADGELVIKLDRAVGHRTLRFGWQKDGAAGGEPELQVRAVKSDSPNRDRLPVVETKGEIALVTIDCTSPDLTGVVLSFRGLPAGGVWVYELNLTADDFKP